MTKKKLNTSGILNELSGQSVFFQKEKSSSPEDQLAETPKRNITVRPVREERGVRNVRDVRPSSKRERKRHPFDIYRDQLDTLSKFKSKHMMETGEMKSMSEMVREALDNYIETKQKRTERT